MQKLSAHSVIEVPMPKRSFIRRSATGGGNGKSRRSGQKSFLNVDDTPGTSREATGEHHDASNITIEILIPRQMSTPPPWPEWEDQYINNESWDCPPGTDHFEESFSPTRILKMTGYTWMRPADYIPSPPAVVKFNSPVLDLINPNAHLCDKSELIRYILSEISELYEYGVQNKTVGCEGEGIAYVPNYTDENRWTPWSHIYSCCKAGVRGEHPNFNPNGKYYVRLYFMGAWRRIAVDDRIPVLPSGYSGLPMTDSNELWPMLLTKALLKIATVTWSESDGRKFSVISALTGWVFEWVDSIDGVNEEELWIDLSNTLPKYSDPKRIPSCYTLLKPSTRKKLLPEEGNDTWWLPPATRRAKYDDDEVEFQPDEFEPLKHTGEPLISFMEIQWKRLKARKSRALSVAPSAGPDGADNKSAKYTIGEDSTQQTVKSMETIQDAEREPSDKIDKKGKKAKKAGIQVPPTTDDRGAKKNKKVKQEQPPPKKEKNDAKDNIEQTKSKVKLPDYSLDKNEDDLNYLDKQNWSKIKDIVFGTSKDILNPRRSKSLPRIPDGLFVTKAEEEILDSTIEEYMEAVQAKQHSGLPSIIEILHGVYLHKYSGSSYKAVTKNWENICGKDSPIALIVVLKLFPRPEDSGERDTATPPIPAFLQHPIHLTEIRDSMLQKVVDGRPTTPLWKRFRWKAWAMKKGLIPAEDQTVKKNIHAIKAKTPFVFKTDWYEYTEDTDMEVILSADMEERLGEYDGEDSDLMLPMFQFSLPDVSVKDMDPAKSSTPPLSQHEPPPPISGGGDTLQRKNSRASNTSNSRGSHKSRKSSGETQEEINPKGSQTFVLYETEYSEGDSEEEAVDESFATAPPEDASPNMACGTVWFECADVAKNLRKFCKFYASQSMFGSCYILKREPTLAAHSLDPVFQEIYSKLPKYPQSIDQYRQHSDRVNYCIDYDRFKTYNVTDYHLNADEGIDSGFYLYSDSWTEQELIITVDILQDDLIKNFADTVIPPRTENLPAVPPPTPNGMIGSFSAGSGSEPYAMPSTSSTLNLIVEPWNWKQDNCRCDPLISTYIDDYWITHVRLPPGRNTFRIWLLLQNETEAFGATTEEVGEDGSVQKRHTFLPIPFSVRIVSQTPIYLGSRIEVQNYMTNIPATLLKQAERLANCIWGLFACFGRKNDIYQQSLDQLRRAYCPLAPEPKMINKFARGVHDTFEGLFVSLITQLNGGMLDRMLIRTLQVLFLNPSIGKDFEEVQKTRRKTHHGHMNFGGKKTKFAVLKATTNIQKYYRGWRVRRLFQLRRRNNPEFKKIEYNVRRIAYLLAKETESVFTHLDQNNDDQQADMDNAAVSPPSILPNPPHWSMDFLKYILEGHPWLINIYPHSNCVNHHVRIQEFQGELPAPKELSKCPFFKNVLSVPLGSKECFCEIDLQVYPSTGIYLKIKNNDTRKSLPLINNRLFIGTLVENENGYTVQCYRWALPGMQSDLTDRAPSKDWKIRVISLQSQAGPVFQEAAGAGSQRTSVTGEEITAISGSGEADHDHSPNDNEEEEVQEVRDDFVSVSVKI